LQVFATSGVIFYEQNFHSMERPEIARADFSFTGTPTYKSVIF